MVAQTAGSRPGRSASSRTEKAPAAARTPPVPREMPEDIPDVMPAFDWVSTMNNELSDRINRLVTSLR